MLVGLGTTAIGSHERVDAADPIKSGGLQLGPMAGCRIIRVFPSGSIAVRLRSLVGDRSGPSACNLARFRMRERWNVRDRRSIQRRRLLDRDQSCARAEIC